MASIQDEGTTLEYTLNYLLDTAEYDRNYSPHQRGQHLSQVHQRKPVIYQVAPPGFLHFAFQLPFWTQVLRNRTLRSIHVLGLQVTA